MKRMAILTSGGDAPGMNAAIRMATLYADSAGCDVYGVEKGYRGLVDGDIARLTPREVAGSFRQGGTILGSARAPDFHERRVRDRARDHLADLGIDGLVVIGGNGSLTGALALTDPEESDGDLKVIGVPASIDNDIGCTTYAIGVDTATNTIVEAIDRLSDTATAHDRTFIIEVMGRDCGYLALSAGLAAGAEVIFFPEAVKSNDDLVESLVHAVVSAHLRKRRSKRVIAVKSEGVKVPCDVLKREIDRRLAEEFPGAGPQVETRVTVLGHVVRGGRPSAFDRMLGIRFGLVAAWALVQGHTRMMTAWSPGPMIPEDKKVRPEDDPFCRLVDLAYVLEETRRMLLGTDPVTRFRTAMFDRVDDLLLR
jgi:6-phosphofructokinase 1